ncbi:MAG: hypothetical protein SR1Q7_09240 [Quinella sp. 1Q7]|nr:hypothetical protein [Quinella sp. 1Q7]
MTEQERINAETQTKLALQDAKFAIFMQELQQQREDIRQINARIDTKFDNISNQIHNLTIAAVVGFGAIALAVGGLVVSLLK